ncbi:hypothetical protein Tco_1234075 [Tanacetum coccineum]
MTILPQPPIAASTEALITAVAATLPLPLPPPLPLTSYSSPLPQIPYPPLPTCPTDVGAPLGYIAALIRLRAESPFTSHPLPLPPPIVLPHTRASMVMMRAVAPSTYILTPRLGTLPSGTPLLLPIPLPTSSPPLLLPSTNYKVDVPKEDPDEIAKEIPVIDVAELGQRMTDFFMTVRQDTDEIYVRLDDAQSDRSLMIGKLNLLHRDRRSHARTGRLMESEAIGIARRGTNSDEDITDSDGSTIESAETRWRSSTS